ncbi:antiviral innate immune response receptor RIG-I-like isoform X2 [Physella acuta]|uniref:antiviral innate immune response receptor RIG-I-like isoform X2 n=1 Tax=Physella acuta TaxID=109671 RepID=UPI0027DC2457|nr:antiviral innate immune response receptor RIG-I-like isoform X2 [Physella acuta]
MWIYSNQNAAHIFSTTQKDREIAANELFEWLLDGEEENEYIFHFAEALKGFASDPASCLFTDEKLKGLRGFLSVPVCCYLNSLNTIIDGSLIQKLTLNDLIFALDEMLNNKVITAKTYTRCKSTMDTKQCFTTLCKSSKINKHEWPFIFINALAQVQPKLFKFSSCNKHSNLLDGLSTENTHIQTAHSGDALIVDNFLPKRMAGPHSVDSDFSSICADSNTQSEHLMESIIEADNGKMPDKTIDETHVLKVLQGTVTDKSESIDSTLIKTQHSVGPLIVDQCHPKRITGPHSVFSDFSSICADSNAQSEPLKEKDINVKAELEESADESHVRNVVKVTEHPSDTVKRIDGKPLRKYQLELAEKAALKGVNTIICAPTGSGKTLVAAYIIFDHLTNSKALKKSKVAFLAKTIPLATQQHKFLSDYLPNCYKTEILTGESKDNLNLKSVLNANDIVVMTPMILQNNIQFKDFQLNEFSLLIFDECHHTRKLESYNTLMNCYIKLKHNNGMQSQMESLPQVVGLTASVGVEKAHDLEQAVTSILSLMANLDVCKLSVVEDNLDDLENFVPRPDDCPPVTLEKLEEDECIKKVNSIMMELERNIDKHAQELNNQKVLDVLKTKPSDRKIQSYEQWVVNLSNAAKTHPIDDPERETNMNVRTLIIISEYLKVYNFALQTNDLVELTDIMPYLKNSFDKFNFKNKTQDEAKLYGYFEDLVTLVDSGHGEENPNLLTLSNTLEEMLIGTGKNSRGIIFVRTRALAEALVSWLNRGNKSFLNASVLTGTNASEAEGGMSPQTQKQVLDDFKEGLIRLIVATSVAEEGLDIPLCNLVIRYNHIGNEVTTMQTRGRCRKEGGKSVLLAMEDVINREKSNIERTKLMAEAINKINQIELSEIKAQISYYQSEIIKNAEIAEKNKDKKDHKEVCFKMVCFLCRQTSIDCSKVRTIYKKHRISIDSDLLKYGKVMRKPRKPYTIDEVDFLGPVLCQGKVEGKGICGNSLGSLIKYKNVQYFAMGIKAFGFFIGTNTDLQKFKQWDGVDYVIEELTPSDTKSYLEKLKNEDGLDQWPATSSARAAYGL